MRKWLIAAVLLGGPLQAVVVRGTVVENQTGQPLSRASLLLEPIPGSKGMRMTAHTNRFGFFEFSGAMPGTYLLQASRMSFLTAQYGQKRWNSSGSPIVLSESDSPFLTIRLLHYGSIVGAVVDENDVGMPEFEVAAYLNTRPPQLVAKGTTDDRGRYRIYGLLPGNYVVRTVGKQVDEVGYKPTFGHETDSLEQARAVDVEIERQSDIGALRPLPGKLFSLTATVTAIEPDTKPATLTFASDMGRQIIHSASNSVTRTFTGLPAGDYEVFGEAPSEPDPFMQGDYQRISVGKDSVVNLVPIKKVPLVTFQFDGISSQSVNDGTVKVLARRKDLAGTYDNRTLTGPTAGLVPGIWEVAISPISGYFASGFSGSGNYIYRRDLRADGWNEIRVTTRGASVRFSLSSSVSTLHGLVKDAGDPVVGAPVFLEPMDLDPAKRLTFAYIAITDTKGQYKFASLAPGHYRVMSTFEYQMPDSKIMTEAGAKEVTLDVRADSTRDLDIYGIR